MISGILALSLGFKGAVQLKGDHFGERPTVWDRLKDRLDINLVGK